MFCLQITSGRQADVPSDRFKNSKKYECEYNYARHMLKQLVTSLSVNSVDMYLAASVNNCSIFSSPFFYLNHKLRMTFFGICFILYWNLVLSPGLQNMDFPDSSSWSYLNTFMLTMTKQTILNFAISLDLHTLFGLRLIHRMNGSCSCFSLVL